MNREVAYYNIRHEFNHSLPEITDFMKAVYISFISIVMVIVDCAAINPERSF